MAEDMIGKIVRVNFADARSKGLAKIIDYEPDPTYQVEDKLGNQYAWKASLCTTPSEVEEQYWRERSDYWERHAKNLMRTCDRAMARNDRLLAKLEGEE